MLVAGDVGVDFEGVGEDDLGTEVSSVAGFMTIDEFDDIGVDELEAEASLSAAAIIREVINDETKH